ncbi:hypothetical protein EXVG_00432 [Emiliania huxleyi virus 202]|nr:hypothetical protein EXVG_00432 [Emiliania huxleyi virus 202]
MSYFTGGFPEQRELYTTVFSDFGMILINDLKRSADINLMDQHTSKKICLQKQTHYESKKRSMEYDNGCKRQKFICA